MTKFQLVLSLIGVLSLSSCNLWGGVDSPSGDDQILSRARGCFDRGDYDCATKYYGQLSSNSADTRIAETALVTMAQDGIFSVADMVRSLGSGSTRGNAASFSTIANFIASRGKTAATYRVELDQLFVGAGSIANTSLKAYTRFLIGLAMTNQILAAAAGTDVTLAADDISSSATACRTVSGSCGDPGTLPDSSVGGTPGTWNGTTTDSNWGNGISINMLLVAVNAAQSNLNTLGGSGSDGLTNILNQIAQIPGGAGAQIKRQTVLNILFP